MKKELRAYIEAELRDYHQTKQDLLELREDLLSESPAPPDGMPKGNATSDSTYQRTVKLMTNRRIRYLQRLLEGLDAVLSELPPDKMKYIELKYWTKPQLLTDAGIAAQIPCDRTTLWRWNNEICTAIGVQLGIVDELQQECNI